MGHKRGEEALGRVYEPSRKSNVKRTVPLRWVPSRNKFHKGAYSILAIKETASDRTIERAAKKLRQSLEAKRASASTSQARSQVTKDLVDVDLAKEALLFARTEHDRKYLHGTVKDGTLNVRKHRAAMPKAKRQMVNAQNTARKWAKKGVTASKLKFQKHGPPRSQLKCNSNNKLAPSGHWRAFQRPAWLRQRDRRLGPYVMSAAK
jgi:hypothetical protein